MRKLLKYLKEYKKYAILTILVVGLESICEVIMPYIMSLLLKYGIGEVNQVTGEAISGDPKWLFIYGSIILVIAIVSLFAGAFGAKFAVKASQGFAKNIRKAEFYKIQDYSFSNIDKFSTSSLVTRLTTDVTNTASAFQMMIRMMIRSPIMLVVATIMAIILNPGLSLTFAIAIPLLLVGVVILMLSAFPFFKKMLRKYDDLNASVQEDLIGIRVVKAYVREDFENEKFLKASESVRRTETIASRVMNLGNPYMQIIMYVSMLAILWIGGNKIIGQEMDWTLLTTFLSYVTQILISLVMISMFFINFVMAKASINRINEVLDEVPDINDDNADKDLKVETGSISFKNVSFSYVNSKDKLVLENIDFDIKSGETVGIIGGTGSSKSTLVQLIPRLYDVSEGEVIVSDHNVKEYTIEELRSEVAMVLQKNVLFSGTIKENLRWGNETASDEEIIEACKKAQADQFIQSFPDGYDTDLGQGGVNVSGGQKQRLCIARALLKNPKIIILDDSTSAVDTATDKSIRDAFKNDIPDVTKIIIAQRVSSVQDADKIIVMDNGKINGIGTHKQLLETNDIYRDVYMSQVKGDEDNA